MLKILDSVRIQIKLLKEKPAAVKTVNVLVVVLTVVALATPGVPMRGRVIMERAHVCTKIKHLVVYVIVPGADNLFHHPPFVPPQTQTQSARPVHLLLKTFVCRGVVRTYTCEHLVHATVSAVRRTVLPMTPFQTTTNLGVSGDVLLMMARWKLLMSVVEMKSVHRL